jgi:CelD/BcsL family acetyltransferase involved in cellulose biosynthesis
MSGALKSLVRFGPGSHARHRSAPTDAPLLDTVSGMHTEVLRDWSRIPELAGEWNALLAQSRAETIFLTWEWIRAWANVVGRQYEPFIVVVRDAAGSLCGIAPLYFAPFSFFRAFRYRVLRMMADSPTGAEYPDWIVRTDCEHGAAACIMRALSEHRREWDCIWLPQVSGWTGAYERIAGNCAPHGFYVNARPIPFAQIELPEALEAYERALSDNRRRQFRAQRSKILRRPGVSIDRCSSADDLPAYLDALIELHGIRRRLLGEEGTFLSRPDEESFYREFVPLAFAAGWLWLSALRENGVFKAVQLGYVYNNAYHQLQEGFDPAFFAGVGNVLRFEVIRQCIEAGIRKYDFLGGYTDHKRRWLARQRNGYDLFIGRAGFTNRVIFFGKVWPTGRYLRPVTRLPEGGAVRWLST